ncbi:promethin domain-containing protein [Ditylenchus destructor]|uniref:Promethin domain-containing protein n=1 Tax=Ditylenchus destructor TaxID=166010 RepID=A0AAD4N0C6_9BILA|nr:promethin domain-containing protein [Ditylenchus destructor]
MQYQLISATTDDRLNLLINVVLLFSAPPIGAFLIYFLLVTSLIWSGALLAQFISLLVGLCVLVPALMFSSFLAFCVTAIIHATKSRWYVKQT